MSSSSHPLEPLLGPLRYACARDFAALGAVKDLHTPLKASLERARGTPAAGAVAALERELTHIDATDQAERRASVLRVVEVLRAQGLDVSFAPTSLPAQRGEGQGEGRAGTGELFGSPSPVQAQKPPPLTKRPKGPPSPQQALPGLTPEPPAAAAAPRPDPLPVAPRQAEGKPAKKPKKEKKKKVEDPDADSPTRILSIAPRSGPLSVNIRDVGWRLNPRLLGLLDKKGVRKVGDVLFLLPRVYEDRRELKKIAALRAGERGTIVAEVRRVDETWGRGRRQFRAILADASGTIAASYFQGGSWLRQRFPIGKRLVVSGEVRQSPWGWEMPHPEVEPAEDVETSPIHFNRIVPVYPGFDRHEQRALRELSFRIAEKYADGIEEPLPDALRARLSLPGLGEALKAIHFPAGDADLGQLDAHLSRFHQRLAFDELFFLQLGMALRRQGIKVQPGIAFDTSPALIEKATALLPFTLTGAQQRVVAQLARDMARPEPMNRLVQGDVGSGKTAVALIAAAVAVQNGYQVAVMAPTEILAEQHHRTFSRLLAPLGVQVVLVTGTGAAKGKRDVRNAIAEGRVALAVGTHALIQESVSFSRLGLVVIDEQHRFGVIQRHALMDKGVRPDVLVMTATPIPRTLAMTMYGDLDVSVIDELPPGRTPIVTKVFVEKARPRAYEQVRSELAQGRQVYVVYPLVEESDALDLKAATAEVEHVARDLLPTARVGLLHGRLNKLDKQSVMEAFKAGRLDVLVCTTVIEVGVDVPNATVMVVQHAERYGLAALHQLRGRVGRGAKPSACLLMSDSASGPAYQRLKVLCETTDGFKIAEEDLKMRGPGELLGTRQHGFPELKVANLIEDTDLLMQARDDAADIVARDGRLLEPAHQALRAELARRFRDKVAFIDVA